MKPHFSCSFCRSSSTSKVLDLGEMGLAGAFLRAEDIKDEQRFLLDLHFCQSCCMLQVGTRPSAEVFFSRYFYSSSVIRTLADHFSSFAARLVRDYPIRESNLRVLEIGCNDGVLLKPLADLGVRGAIGVDPASNIVDRINDSRLTVINDFFSHALALDVVKEHGFVDLLLANNVFAHIDDISDALRGIAACLSDDGTFIFENHYLCSLVDHNQYDMIYHEHIYYYSATSVSKAFLHFGLSLVDVEETSTHGGSMRFFVRKRGAPTLPSKRLQAVLYREQTLGLSDLNYYLALSKRICHHGERLKALVRELRAQGRRVCGYGASGRANTVLQYCGFSVSDIEFIVDDSPVKQGFLTPGSHIPVIAGDIDYLKENIDYIIVFAWSFRDEVLNRLRGFSGAVILPFPKIEVLRVDL